MMIVVTVASGMIGSSLLFCAYANRQLGVDQATFLLRVLAPGLAPYAIAYALVSITAGWADPNPGDRLQALWTVALNGALYALIVPVVLYRLLCDWGEREFLRKQTLHSVRSLLPARWRTA
jgi:hypothetical protein